MIDNTNVNRKERARYITLAKAEHFRAIGYYFQSTISDALERNRRRNGAQVIPEKGVAGTHKRLQLPQFDEGLDELYYVSIKAAHDHCVLPGLFMAARIDGRNFTRLARETHHFDAPFDERMRDHMVETTRHLFQWGFRILYGYTQSDEISLRFHPRNETFGRKLRKLNSILAGQSQVFGHAWRYCCL